MTKLGINVDHIATLRQARREGFPDPVEAAILAVRNGANGITAHLREDRRHIQDRDLIRLKEKLSVPLNMEMAADSGIIQIARRLRPDWACLVPEKREELTTEGGLNVKRREKVLAGAVRALQDRGIKVSLFVDPEIENIRAALRIGADAVEIHTGAYARLFPTGRLQKELKKIIMAARVARGLGLIVNAGHGLDYENVGRLARSFPFDEFNIGFAIIARALAVGIPKAVREMKDCMSLRARRRRARNDRMRKNHVRNFGLHRK